MNDVRLELEREDADALARGEIAQHDVSVGNFVQIGLDLEEQQYVGVFMLSTVKLIVSTGDYCAPMHARTVTCRLRTSSSSVIEIGCFVGSRHGVSFKTFTFPAALCYDRQSSLLKNPLSCYLRRYRVSSSTLRQEKSYAR